MSTTALPELTVNVFPGGFNWGLYTGIDKGFFAAHGVSVRVLGTPNSVTQMTELSQGKFDIAMTAVDNIVAYVEGQGEAPIGPQPDFTAVMGSDSGFLSLVAAPSITRIEDLAGKTVSVESGTTNRDFLAAESAKLQKQGKKSISIKTFPKDTDAAAALKAGRVDAYFGDSPVAVYYADRDKSFAIGGAPIAPIPIGIALRKGDPLAGATTKAIAALYKNGSIKKIVAKWGMSHAVTLLGK